MDNSLNHGQQQKIINSMFLLSGVLFITLGGVFISCHQVASTKLNEDSSRSHSVCMVSFLVKDQTPFKGENPNLRTVYTSAVLTVGGFM